MAIYRKRIFVNNSGFEYIYKEYKTKGVYAWKIDGNLKYVGESINIKKREEEHIRCADYFMKDDVYRGKSSKSKWSKAEFELYTLLSQAESIDLIVLEEVDDENSLCDREEYWINKLISDGHLLIDSNISGSPKNRKTPIDVYDLNGNMLGSFESTSMASRFTNVSSGHIYEVCTGKLRRLKSFVFRYKGDSFDKYKTPNDVVEYIGFETKPTTRSNFKKRCDKWRLNFDDFEEVFVCKRDNNKLFTYHFKNKISN